MTTTAARESPEAAASPPGPRRWAPAAALAAVAVLGAALVIGGGTALPDLPGVTDPGPATRWGLPLARVVLDGAAAVTVGFLLLAALLPPAGRDLGTESQRALRVAGWSAAVWALAAGAVHVLTLSDLAGLPVRLAVADRTLVAYTADVEQGRALAAVILLTAVLAPATRLTTSHRGAQGLLAVGVGALVPPALVGHASAGSYHHPAATSLLVHVVAVALWVGGLVALAWYAAAPATHLRRVAGRYSALALGCFVMVAASGALNASLRLTGAGDLVATAYGWLLLGKVAAVVALGTFGYLHRRRSLGMLAAGRAGAFRRLAAGEVVVMAATMGLAVGLARTPPPAPEALAPATRAQDLLGFPPPPELTAGRLVTQVYPEAAFALGLLAAGLLYAGGVLRLRRRGDRWPPGRAVAWYLGLATVAATTLTGVMTYGMVLFSVHMAQHMVLTMLAPVLLVLGAPVTLALRALRPAPRGEQGARELLVAVTASRPVAVLTHPLVAFAIFVSGTFAVYFTGVFEYAVRHHTAHLLVMLHFLLSGYLFYTVLIGVDPLPRRPPHLARVALQFAAMAVHAFFGVAVMQATRLVGGGHYRQLGDDIGWLPDPLPDQLLAGQIAWGFGEIPALVVLGALLVQWMRSDDRAARRFDRSEAARGDAQLAAYNAYLAELNRRHPG